MKKIFYLLAFMFSILLIAFNASAVTYTEMQYQTEAGQVFTFGGPVALSDGSDGFFTIEASGDYFGKGPNGNENLGFDIDGIFIVNDIYFPEGSPQIIVWDTETDNTHWINTWTIPGADLFAITSDLAGLVEVTLFPGVGTILDENDWVEVTLEYNAVPVPGALILLGSGLLGLLGIRRMTR